jgi:hypothetical protein
MTKSQRSIWSSKSIQSTFETPETLAMKTAIFLNSDFAVLKIEMPCSQSARFAIAGHFNRTRDFSSILLSYKYLL